MKKIVLSLISFAVWTISGYGQKAVRCATDEVIKQQMAIDPEFAKKVKEARKKVNGNREERLNKGKPVSITIPVVVHVVYNTAEENISDQQVQSQIDVMNEDFTATNSDYNKYDAGYKSVKGDLNIQYCLVQVIRKQTNHTKFPLNDAMKFSKRGGSDAVDPMHYLNIWVCDIGDSYLGYAYIPGTISPDRFGVVCHYLAFGKGSQYNLFTNYNLGRTVTHEIGHSLGLEHIWGDAVCGNDFVDDTPLHNTYNFGCPGEGHLSTCVGTPLEMWMNYMDYTYDKCMYFFSDGQGARADYFIANDPQLNSIINSACISSANSNDDITSESTNRNNALPEVKANRLLLYPRITTGQLILTTDNAARQQTQIDIYNQNGALVMTRRFFIANGKSNTYIDAGSFADGIYFMQVKDGTGKRTEKFIVQH